MNMRDDGCKSTKQNLQTWTDMKQTLELDVKQLVDR